MYSNVDFLGVIVKGFFLCSKSNNLLSVYIYMYNVMVTLFALH